MKDGRKITQHATRNTQRAVLDGGRFEVGLGSGAEEIGTQVAQALYRGLKP
jgi:hypothetical protein